MGERDPNGLTLTVVGSGTAVPEPDRVCSGYFIESGDVRVLFDCGSGVVHHLARFGVDWQHLTHVAVTHFHNDHIGDLPMLFFALKHGMLPPRTDPLAVIGPVGLADRMERLADALGDHVRDPGFPVEVLELLRGEIGLAPGLTLRAHRTPHTAESIAYRLDAPNASVGYTGDTGHDESLAAFLSSVDVLVMECSLPDDRAIDAHLTPARAARMAAAAGPGLLLVTHVYPLLPRDQVPELIREAGWTGRVQMAQDGLRLRFPGDAGSPAS